MIRSIHHLACAALGALFILAFAAYHEQWAWLPLVLLVPWDKLAHWAYRFIREYIEYREQKEQQEQHEFLLARERREP